VKNLDRQNKKLTQSLLKRGIDPNNFVRVQDLLPIINELEDEINAIPTPSVEPLRYKALLTQTGTDAPVATVLENSLGATISFTYIDAGTYKIVSSSPILLDAKTIVVQGAGNTTALASLWVYRDTDSEWFLEAYDLGNIGGGFNLANDIMTNQYILIEVYP
jgi:hypothetical protein